jgi:hypothetical protein
MTKFLVTLKKQWMNVFAPSSKIFRMTARGLLNLWVRVNFRFLCLSEHEHELIEHELIEHELYRT